MKIEQAITDLLAMNSTDRIMLADEATKYARKRLRPIRKAMGYTTV